MKKLIFLILLLPSLCFGGSIQDAHKAVIGRMNVSAPAGGTDFTADANCQAAYLFASGSTTTDSSGEGNTLTNTGTTTFSSADLPSGFSTGQAAVFNGSSQSLSRTFANMSANFPGKATKTNFAYSLWIKHDDAASGTEGVTGIGDSWKQVWDWISAGYDDFGLNITDTDPTNAWNVLAANNLITNWYHVVVSFAGADPTGTATVWISTDSGSFGDTVNATTFNFTNVKEAAASATEYPFCIGAELLCASSWYDGKIYQPIVFDRVITNAAEAQELYDTGITGAD